MTPGQDALAEAMRLEQARIYGQLHSGHTTAAERAERASLQDRDDKIARLDGEGLSAASIAFQLGVKKPTVVDTLRRLGRAS